MHKTMYKMGLIAILIIMFCNSACLDPIENSFDINENVDKTLVINEIVASSSDSDNDWIELYNASKYPLYLGDYSIADDNAEHEPFPLPDLSLGPFEFIVIQATNEPSSGESYYVPFRLGDDDRLTLYWGLAIIDILDWEDNDAPSGYSFGRFPDGIGKPYTLLPTPCTINKEGFGPALVINEILASSGDGGNDWVELFVVSEDPVYLGDYSLVDDNIEREPTTLPSITLNPGEFIVIFATDAEPEDGSYYVPFRLGADDSVILIKGSKQCSFNSYKDSYIVDVLDWEDGDAPAGNSYGCLPDGSKEVQTLIPTPGEPNVR